MENYMTPHHLRGLIQISGADRFDFLQGLITQDVYKLSDHPILWSAFLTPQGKFLNEFFILNDPDQNRILLDTAGQDHMMQLGGGLRRHVLSLQVKLTLESNLIPFSIYHPNGDVIPHHDIQGILQQIDGTQQKILYFQDPRHEKMGWRLYLNPAQIETLHVVKNCYFRPESFYHRLRIHCAIPDQIMDLHIEKSLLLEHNFDVFGAIDWEKGCYRGQELTARTKYRGLIKRRLCPVIIHDDPSYPALAQDQKHDILFENQIIGNLCGLVAPPLSGQNTVALALLPMDVIKQHFEQHPPSTALPPSLYLSTGQGISLYRDLPANLLKILTH